MNTSTSEINRIKELTALLNEASKAYYDDAVEIMPNIEYDALYDELLELESKTGFVMDNSPTQNVGYETKTSLPKVRHESKMLSLNKTKSRDELAAWLGSKEGVLSYKLDGLTVVLTYDGGVLKSAVTRGNGSIGEVVTDNVLTCQNIPKNINFKQKLIIRGEAVILYSDFEKINNTIDDIDARYKNPRNLCSGSLRQLDPNVTRDRHVRFYAFLLKSAEGMDFDNSLIKQLQWLETLGFDVVEFHRVDSGNLLSTLEGLESGLVNLDIPSDGLVLAYEDLLYAKGLGATSKFPHDAIAFKWQDQEAETVLREIEWSPSRTGLLNPVAIFDPVELEGTTVSRASVHNISIIEELELGIGDIIKVYKANMIIPQISANLTKSRHIEIPPSCPVCGADTEIKALGTAKTLYCTNPGCVAKSIKSFSLFVSRDAFNIEGLSDAILERLIGNRLIKTLPDIFRLKNFKDKISSMDGFGDKSTANLLAAIDRARRVTVPRLLYSLCIPGIGTTTAGLIADYAHNDFDKILKLSEPELLAIPGVGAVLSQDFVKFFADHNNQSMLADLLKMIDLDQHYEAADDKLQGKVFVITGSLNQFENRKELEDRIKKLGGKTASSVSSNTDYLITNDPGSGSAKNQTAKELGVPIISEEEIINMLNS